MLYEYAGRDIEGLEAAIDERFVDWISRIRTQSMSTSEKTTFLDIGKYVQYLAVDIITHLCFGAPLGFVEHNKDMYGFLGVIEDRLPIVQHFSVLVELNTFLRRVTSIPAINKLFLPRATDKSGVGKILGVGHKSFFDILHERRA